MKGILINMQYRNKAAPGTIQTNADSHPDTKE
jgi:hypothetical protein